MTEPVETRGDERQEMLAVDTNNRQLHDDEKTRLRQLAKKLAEQAPEGQQKTAELRWYDVLEVWRAWTDHVQGHALDCGHYLPEEAPEATLAALKPFLTQVNAC